MALLKFTNLNKYGNKRSRIVHRPTTQISIDPSGFGSYVHVNVFKYEYKHPVMAPTLLKTDGKTYLMPEWREVHPETTLNAVMLKSLTSSELFKTINTLITNKKYLSSLQRLNYKNFKYSHEYITGQIDEIRNIFFRNI